MQHLDEGTIHAWLDGALGPNEAAAAEAHVQGCAQCAQAVAEARGLIAASSRVLAALDDVPAVQESARMPLRVPGARRHSGWWWRRAGIGYAAAATALLAVGTTMVLRNASPDAAMDRAASPVAATTSRVEPETVRAFRDASVSERRAGAPGSPERPRDESREEQGSATRAKLSASQPPKKEDLVIDRVVPLPGPMPRATAPAPTPPSIVRQEARKALADMAANVAPSSARGAVVQGRVLDASTGAPVAGATVSIDTMRVSARTDGAGKFQLLAVPLGQQTVRVRAFGFDPVQHPVAIAPSDSVELGFALQKTTKQLQGAVATGGAAQEQVVQRRQVGASREGMRAADSIRAPQAASPVLRLDDIRENAKNVVGCYTLRAVAGKERDADRAVASMPSRVQLENEPRVRAQSNELLINRARTLEGVGRAESWRFVGDSLEFAWTDNVGRHVLRFARREARWTSDLAVMESCPK